MKKIRDLAGQKFNRLLALEYVETKQRQAYWKFRCDCGKEEIYRGVSVSTGNRKSCGCLRKEKTLKILKGKRKAYGESCRNALFTHYKAEAKRRNLDFTLDKNEFLELVKRNCFYCNRKPSNQFTVPWNKDIYFYSGLDREDNSLGYTTGNVFSCCVECNYSKNDRSIEDFLSWIKKIYNHLNLEEK